MNKSVLRILAVICVLCGVLCTAACAREKESPSLSKNLSLPVKAAVEVPVAPIPVRADGKSNLVYEIHITNLGSDPLTLTEIGVFKDSGYDSPLVSYKGKNFNDMLGGFGTLAEGADIREIKPGVRVVAYIWVALDSNTPVPNKLHHRITFRKNGDSEKGLSVLDVPTVVVNKETPPVIRSPLFGNGWLAAEGPINIKDYSHHRFGIITLEGKPRVPQRFAIDWMKLGPNGKLFRGNPSKNESWYCYGEKIHSVADGVVTEVKDGIPDNVPLAPERAVPMTLETLSGNHVVVDNGSGCFALYAHMKPGSVRVKAGDKVQAGQVLGLLGNSGNSDAPHLHFQINTTPSGSVLASEGLPYEIEYLQLEGRVPVPFKNVDNIDDLTWKPKPGAKPANLKNEMPLGYRIYAFSER